MARKDAGNYGEKHPEEIEIDPEIADRIWKGGDKNAIACEIAHKIAEELDVTAEEVGQTIDLMEWKIEKCQLGLFGYGEKKKIIFPLEDIPATLEKAVKKRAPQGYLSCQDLWAAAKEAEATKLDAACAAEGLKLKIRNCQLGSFK
ncbi:MAG: hypothetical protein JEY99_20640 [Spirochaetales bacterium]|nr:hypothetical protein [Spirochaetales bacterium]